MKESEGLAFEILLKLPVSPPAPTQVQEFLPHTLLTEAGSYRQPNPLRPVIQRRVDNYLAFKKENLRAI